MKKNKSKNTENVETVLENSETVKNSEEQEFTVVDIKKKKLKKTFKIVLYVFLGLFAFVGLLSLVYKLVIYPGDDQLYPADMFYPADYDKNILEDEWYMSHDRGIYYNRYGKTVVLDEENIKELPNTARFFYNYFDCLVMGDYQNYPSFYTQSCLDNPRFNVPEKFTMQAIYDISVEIYSVSHDEETNVTTEVYFVDYRIFENNGTYRRDILPEESRIRVFEIQIVNGTPLINSISFVIPKPAEEQ